MVGKEMRADHRRAITTVSMVVAIAALAIAVLFAGNTGYNIGYWLGSH